MCFTTLVSTAASAGKRKIRDKKFTATYLVFVSNVFATTPTVLQCEQQSEYFISVYWNIAYCIYRVVRKKLNKTFSYNSGCLAVIIRLLFNSHDGLRLWHRRKCSLLLCISKCLRRETTESKFLYFFVRDTKWVRSQTLSRCLVQPSTRSRSGWTMAKELTDVQAVVERLLWIVTACGMSIEAVPGRPCPNMQGDLGLEQQPCDELSLNLKPSRVSLWKDHCTAYSCYPRQALWKLPGVR